MITVTSRSNNGQVDTLYTGANMTDARNAMNAEVASIEAQNAKFATPMSVEYVNGSITGAIVTWANVTTTIVINDSEQMNSDENVNGDDTKGNTMQSLTSFIYRVTASDNAGNGESASDRMLFAEYATLDAMIVDMQRRTSFTKAQIRKLASKGIVSDTLSTFYCEKVSTTPEQKVTLTSDSTVVAPAIVTSVSAITGFIVYLDNDGMFTSSRDSAHHMTELKAHQLIRAKRCEMKRAGRENSLWFDAGVAVY